MSPMRPVHAITEDRDVTNETSIHAITEDRDVTNETSIHAITEDRDVTNETSIHAITEHRDVTNETNIRAITEDRDVSDISDGPKETSIHSETMDNDVVIETGKHGVAMKMYSEDTSLECVSNTRDGGNEATVHSEAQSSKNSVCVDADPARLEQAKCICSLNVKGNSSASYAEKYCCETDASNLTRGSDDALGTPSSICPQSRATGSGNDGEFDVRGCFEDEELTASESTIADSQPNHLV